MLRVDEYWEWLRKVNNFWKVKVIEIIYGDIDMGGYLMEDFEIDF